MNATEILKITKPEQIFFGSGENIKKKFHKLALNFHPDTNPGCEDAFKKVNELYRDVLDRIKDGTWGDDGAYRVELRDGHNYDIHSISDRAFELGHMYIGHDHVTYMVDKKHNELFSNATKKAKFKFDSQRMRDQIESYLPKDPITYEMKNGNRILKIKKDPLLLNLRDVLTYYEGRLPGKHAAWIIGTLNNLACYLNYCKISHQAINVDTYFINPKMHTGALLGGWWYAKSFGEDVKYIPSWAIGNVPFKLLTTKKAQPLTDSELIRSLGRTILDHPVMKVPRPIGDWLNSVAIGDAIKNYSDWAKARDASGPREFIKMMLNEKILYGEV